MRAAVELTEPESRLYYSARVPGVKESGAARQRAACPIHGGTGKNLAIDLVTGRYYCFSTCACGGDAIAFEQALHGGDFIAARDRVFDIIGRPPISKPATSRRDSITATPAEIATAHIWQRTAVRLAEESLHELKGRFFDPSADRPVDMDELQAETRRLAHLESLSGMPLVMEYRRMSVADPEHTEATVATGNLRERAALQALERFLAAMEAEADA